VKAKDVHKTIGGLLKALEEGTFQETTESEVRRTKSEIKKALETFNQGELSGQKAIAQAARIFLKLFPEHNDRS